MQFLLDKKFVLQNLSNLLNFILLNQLLFIFSKNINRKFDFKHHG